MFSKHKGQKDGLQCQCKKCFLVAYKRYKNSIRGTLNRKYHSMKYRCGDPSHPSYQNYGGRGIKCLFTSPEEFIDYVTDKLKVDPRELETDRIDNNGHYEPGNIRFVTHRKNSSNRRKKLPDERLITKKGEEVYRCRHHDFECLTTEQTAQKLNISIRQVNKRLACLRANSPQLFPILSQEQANVWSQWFDGGLTCVEIAAGRGVTPRSIQAQLQRIKRKMNYDEKVNSRAHKTVSFDIGVDETKIKQKF